MINKLLLVREANTTSDILDKSGVRAYASQPLSISPIAWHDEHGLSHYGFELKGMMLKDFQSLEDWIDRNDGVTLLNHDGDVTATLASVGLRINESAK